MTIDDFNRLRGSQRAEVLPSSEPDFDRYRAELASFALEAEAETELLRLLWEIMSAFVDKGFTVDVCAHVFGAEDILPHGRNGQA